jgi:anti-anti-sigma regulatory factor
MAVTEPLHDDVQVRADGRRVVVILRTPLDHAFAEVLGAGLAAALDGQRGLLVDVSRMEPDDVAGMQALGRLIDVVAAEGHEVAVRGARETVRAYLRLRHPVSFVTQL